MKIFDPADAVAAMVASKYTKKGSGRTQFLLSKDEPTFWEWAKLKPVDI